MQGYFELVKSRRFVLIILAALTWLFSQPAVDLNTVLQALTAVFGGAVTVGSIDKLGEKIGGK